MVYEVIFWQWQQPFQQCSVEKFCRKIINTTGDKEGITCKENHNKLLAENRKLCFRLVNLQNLVVVWTYGILQKMQGDNGSCKEREQRLPEVQEVRVLCEKNSQGTEDSRKAKNQAGGCADRERHHSAASDRQIVPEVRALQSLLVASADTLGGWAADAVLPLREMQPRVERVQVSFLFLDAKNIFMSYDEKVEYFESKRRKKYRRVYKKRVK